jgi:type I restriction enzyme, S subunit
LKSNLWIDYVSSIVGGSAQPGANAKQFSDFSITLPSLPTQTAIAEILSSLDDKIELNNAINKNLEALAQALFKQWFVDFEFPISLNCDSSDLGDPHDALKHSTTNQGKHINHRADTYKSSGGEMVESELGEIPKGWRVEKISEVFDVTDFVANGSFASLAEYVKYKSEPDFAILIRLTDYNRNYNGDFVYVNESAYNFLNKSKLLGGEIIIANVGANAGTVFRAPYFDRPMTLGPNSIMIKNNDFVNYLYLYLISTIGQYMINGIISGSAQPKFNKTDFRKIEIILPNKNIIQRFNEVYNSLNNKIKINRKQIEDLINLRDTLLPKLISGELTVNQMSEL